MCVQAAIKITLELKLG